MSITKETLLSPAEVAGVLGVHVATLLRWRARKQGPAWLEVSPRTIRYRESEVTRWLENRSRQAAA